MEPISAQNLKSLRELLAKLVEDLGATEVMVMVRVAESFLKRQEKAGHLPLPKSASDPNFSAAIAKALKVMAQDILTDAAPAARLLGDKGKQRH